MQYDGPGRSNFYLEMKSWCIDLRFTGCTIYDLVDVTDS